MKDLAHYIDQVNRRYHHWTPGELLRSTIQRLPSSTHQVQISSALEALSLPEQKRLKPG